MEEKEFKGMMKFSKIEILFPEFEENVMKSVKKAEAYEKSFWRNIRWSWFLFFCGLFLGIFIMDFMGKTEFGIFDGSNNLVFLSIEIIMVVMVGLQLDNVLKLTFRKKSKF